MSDQLEQPFALQFTPFHDSIAIYRVPYQEHTWPTLLLVKTGLALCVTRI